MTALTPELARILFEVAAERVAQDEKWGPQNHPVLYYATSREGYARAAEAWKRINDRRVAARNLVGAPPDRNSSWDGVLLEEVFEAFAEADPKRIREELVQVAAVAVAAIECLDRASKGATT